LPNQLQGKIESLQAAADQIAKAAADGIKAEAAILSKEAAQETIAEIPAPIAEPAPKPVRKPRVPKSKPAAESLSALGAFDELRPSSTRSTSEIVAEPEPKPAEPLLSLDEAAEAPAEPSETAADAIASDGATRLLVTAYIGIGNRLFIRGEGPGLSWEKGVPLQFVSIGKWRWEADGASAPVKFKLYKNDQVECVSLGERDLAPGHQQEVTATF
jgi:hypothetical protein